MNRPNEATVRLHGPESLAASFKSAPILLSDAKFSDVAVCSWRVNIERYDVGEMPEALVGLHTNGIVYETTPVGRVSERSVSGQLTLIPAGGRASYHCDGILGVSTVHLSEERLEYLLGDHDAKRLLGSLRMRLGFNDPCLRQ
jgi:hypothetical protein